MVCGMDELERMKRWRLILGSDSKERFASMNEGAQIGLSKDQMLMDQALAAIYNRRESGGFGAPLSHASRDSSPTRGAGKLSFHFADKLMYVCAKKREK